ncbi:putative transcription factor MADS-type1 family [Helianthus annuus]|nr:agamous-like MADS-box protein AGL80 [Helianthus annuus]KAJ0456680.1 putative transcription factor MADS-type1 family [Helianthus annuus]KAJ0845635.1 putative transcription factor MADS-type1 family [Helianthus annuus]
MPRSKVKLAFIENQKARKSSFMKRKECLKNKLKELSTLCGIEACAIIYSSYEPGLEVWPEDNTAFQNVLNAFLMKLPMERNKFMSNQDSYIKERISKVDGQIKKQIVTTRDFVKAKLMSECLSGKVSLAGLNSKDLNNLGSFAGHKLPEIEERIKVLKSDAFASQLQRPEPKEVVGCSNTASHMAAAGTNVDCYVPVMENTGWYPPDWTSDHVEHGLDPVPGVNMMNPFPDDPIFSWSDAYIPKKTG